jgi:ribose-phosphate pyrophosphokinase
VYRYVRSFSVIHGMALILRHIETSIRNQHVFIIQSGSSRMNDSVIELLIMCSACNGGSAKSITGMFFRSSPSPFLTYLAVMPYFPYSRQSKKKSHRGAITARMIANLLQVAGVDHVITIDLHSSQMQGFFNCPVDNIVAEPLLANWIRRNVPDWKEGVVVSKNPGGTRRVTSLADALALNFAIITTERRRPAHTYNLEPSVFEKLEAARRRQENEELEKEEEDPQVESEKVSTSPKPHFSRRRTISNDIRRRPTSKESPSSPLAKSALRGGMIGDILHLPSTPANRLRTAETQEDSADWTDEVHSSYF